MAAGSLRSVSPAPGALAFEDLAVGQRASLVRRILPADLDLDAALETSAPVEQPAPGRGAAEGLFMTGLVSALIGTRLPGPGAAHLSQGVQFLGPVRVGDVVTASVEIVELVPSRRRARLYCECTCDGRPVLEGEAWVFLAPHRGG